jgi:hypothetical protein
MNREFPDFKTLGNDLVTGLLQASPVTSAANQLANQPPSPLVLVRQVGFGSVKAYLYRVAPGGVDGKNPEYPGDVFDQYRDTDERFLSGFSRFGTQVVCNMVIKAPGHRNPSTGASVPPASIVLDLVLADVTQERNIVVTPVNGRDGTVKEYISDGDYQISIRGKIVGIGYLYPLDAVKNLIKVCRAKVAVDVESPYLREVFGITRMVITSWKMGQEEGIEGEQMFEMMALSESALETELAQTTD